MKLYDKTKEELIEIILRKDDTEKKLRKTIHELNKMIEIYEKQEASIISIDKKTL